jgi:hypothetical protein
MLDNERLDHKNGNIPKSAILALGMCRRDFLLAENVGEGFKRTIVTLVIGGIGHLPRYRPRTAFRRLMIASVVQGGLHSPPNDWAYGQQLNAGYETIDNVLRERLGNAQGVLRLSSAK